MENNENKRSIFNEFLLKEYENISQAHYTTVNQVTQFFRYYLLILSAPSIIILMLDNNFSNIESIFKRSNFSVSLSVSIFFYVISIIGTLISIYVINLRHDAILYARTVNGIRKYYFDNSKVPEFYSNTFRTLPITTNQPNYYEKAFFGPIVISFSVINSLYFTIANIILGGANYQNILPAILVIIFHLLVYKYLSIHAEKDYLMTHTIGVDIDGVLNDHKRMFCEVYNKLFNQSIKPEQIKKIPVHLNPELNVSKENEQLVFHQPEYWIDMYPSLDDFSILKKYSKSYKIIIFTKRNWPLKDIIKTNKKVAQLWKKKGIKKITENWLKKMNIFYHKLYVEIADDSLNRFALSKRMRLQYFIEDDINNAKMLSNICETVFLVNQTYNEENSLPQNVIRINSLNELVNYLPINL